MSSRGHQGDGPGGQGTGPPGGPRRPCRGGRRHQMTKTITPANCHRVRLRPSSGRPWSRQERERSSQLSLRSSRPCTTGPSPCWRRSERPAGGPSTRPVAVSTFTWLPWTAGGNRSIPRGSRALDVLPSDVVDAAVTGAFEPPGAIAERHAASEVRALLVQGHEASLRRGHVEPAVLEVLDGAVRVVGRPGTRAEDATERARRPADGGCRTWSSLPPPPARRPGTSTPSSGTPGARPPRPGSSGPVTLPRRSIRAPGRGASMATPTSTPDRGTGPRSGSGRERPWPAR